MNFGFTEEQDVLRAEVRKFLDENAPLDEVRKISESAAGHSPEQWRRIAELGWTGLIVPECHGGAGLGAVDLVVLLEETGRTLYPSPLLSTTTAAAALLAAGSDAQRARWLPALAEGAEIGTLAFLEAADRLDAAGVELAGEREADAYVLRGEKCFVPDAGAATLFIVPFRTGPAPEDLALAVVPRGAEGVAAEDFPGMDLTKRIGRLTLDGVRVPADAILGRPGRVWPALARTLDFATAAVTAEAIGAAEGALALTTEYARNRIQFGSPIGRYQAVKHPLAEMYVDIESWKSLCYYAAWALDESPDEAPRYVSMAKAYASEAFARIGIDVIQLHGAVGYTWEFDAHLYLKRSKWVRPMYGDADYHYDRVAALGGL
ncbi:MAG: acyl-CoA dehydrogenase [Deltaproteobacteria bacterium]|nr:MAG: acyl-CoA dehydrogenase [Deltaproteobacteria bacterium]